LEFSEFGLGFLAGGTALVIISRLGDNLLKFEPVDDGAVFEAVGLERGDLLLQVGEPLSALLLELCISSSSPRAARRRKSGSTT
jgi:hypothetical protein